jgi:hypothetical protein
VQPAKGKPLTQAEVDWHYQQLLAQVERAQEEQIAALRFLIKYHGLKRIFIEALTPDGEEDFNLIVEALKEPESHQATLRQRQQEMQKLLAKLTAEGAEKTPRYAKAKVFEKEIADMIAGHRRHLLQIGAAGRLLLSGDLQQVLPLDDAEALADAKPAMVDDKLTFDKAKVFRRQQAIVHRALAGKPVAVIILGGAHDLSDAVRAAFGDRCEYLRVRQQAFRTVYDPSRLR